MQRRVPLTPSAAEQAPGLARELQLVVEMAVLHGFRARKHVVVVALVAQLGAACAGEVEGGGAGGAGGATDRNPRAPEVTSPRSPEIIYEGCSSPSAEHFAACHVGCPQYDLTECCLISPGTYGCPAPSTGDEGSMGGQGSGGLGDACDAPGGLGGATSACVR